MAMTKYRVGLKTVTGDTHYATDPLEVDQEVYAPLPVKDVRQRLKDAGELYKDDELGTVILRDVEVPAEQLMGVAVELVSISKSHDLQRQELELVTNAEVGDTVELGENPAHPLEPDQKHVRIGDMVFLAVGGGMWKRDA